LTKFIKVFLTDCQSALAFLSTAPTFLQLKSLWDIWDLSDSFLSRVALNFQLVPSHAGLPCNELVDSLAKTGATLPFTYVPSPLALVIAKIRYTRYSWRRNLSHNLLFCQIPSVSSEDRALPRLIRCVLSWLRCHGYSLLLSSYLCRIKRKENSSCSACRHSLHFAGSNLPPSGLSRI